MITKQSHLVSRRNGLRDTRSVRRQERINRCHCASPRLRNLILCLYPVMAHTRTSPNEAVTHNGCGGQANVLTGRVPAAWPNKQLCVCQRNPTFVGCGRGRRVEPASGPSLLPRSTLSPLHSYDLQTRTLFPAPYAPQPQSQLLERIARMVGGTPTQMSRSRTVQCKPTSC